MIVVVAGSKERARTVLARRDPPIHPRSRRAMVLTHVTEGIARIRGVKFGPTDELIWDSDPAGPAGMRQALATELIKAGFTEDKVRRP